MYLQVPKSTWRYLKEPNSTWKYQKVPESTCKYLKVSKSTWKYLHPADEVRKGGGNGIVGGAAVGILSTFYVLILKSLFLFWPLFLVKKKHTVLCVVCIITGMSLFSSQHLYYIEGCYELIIYHRSIFMIMIKSLYYTKINMQYIYINLVKK